MSLVYQLLLMAALVAASYLAGRSDGDAIAEGRQSADREAAHLLALDRARVVTNRATNTGRAREADRAGLDTFFTRLAEEARHDTPAAVDACELPADRLRRWADANAGSGHQGAAAAEPDGAASAPAATGFWARARLGSQPPAGGAGLSPAGQPAVPPAGVPGAGAD